jgi:hypothetical protein
MGVVEVAFAVVVTLLAGAAVILALVVAVYWLALQARRLRAQLRHPADPVFWRDRGALSPRIPERRP